MPEDPERFVYHEAELLDARRFEEWLALLADDIVYWVPNFVDGGAPGDNGVIVREDLLGLRARVARIRHGQNPTQMPPPRTVHFLTNVITADCGGEDAEVRANLMLCIAKDETLAQYPGKVAYKLRRTEDSWRIQAKTIYLVANNLAIGQLPLL